jgi:predicted ATPase/DNA-binding SARP family transcriptional activator
VGSGLSLRVLGPVEAWRDDKPLGVGGQKPRVLLAALLAQYGEVVSTDRLCDALWGDDPPPSAAATLQSHISRLRRLLAPEAEIAARPPGYALTADVGVVDAVEFVTSIAAASAPPAPSAASGLEERLAAVEDALAAWRGRAFEGVADLEWARAEAVRLEELRLGALEELIDGRLTLGQEGRVIGELERLVVTHPLRERFWRQLVLALYRTGRQAEALRRANDVRVMLREELGLDTSAELRELEARILADDPSLRATARVAATATAGRVGAHEATRFVGRHADIEAVDALLRREHLVTLVGPGGVGKTRLALRSADLLRGEFADGVAVVELAEVSDGASTSDAVATVLDIQQRQHLSVEDSVIELLRDSEVLVVFDNCEHLVEDVARLVARLRSSCPGVSVLATSREPLGIAGECVWSVEPLALPLAEELDLEHVVASPAVQLFVDRAVSALPSFELTAANAGAVAEICRRLDGLPLALELAAPRLRMMGPEVLAERLDRRFALLTEDRRGVDARHRTLRAVVDWSHDLLPAEEQAVFARLSMFAAGFDLRAAEAVCAADGTPSASVVGLLANLVDRSMVQVVDRDEPRYRLLEMLRDYGREQLERRGDLGGALARHLAWYVSVAREGALGLTGPDEAYWMARLDRDLANFREAHANALRAGDVSAASALVIALREFALRRIRYEVTSWATATVSAAGFDAEPRAPIVLAVGAYGGFVRGDLELAIEWGHRAVDLAEQLGTDTSGQAERALGNALFYRGDSDEALEWMDRMVDSARGGGSSARLAHALYMRSVAHTSTGDPIRGAALAGEARAEAVRCGSPTAHAQAAYALGLSLEASDPEAADRVLRRSAALGAECGNRWIEAFALTEVHALEARRGETTAALRGFANVINTWYRGGDWANQWLSLRHVCGALATTGAVRAAAVLHGALSAAGAAYALPATPNETAGFERLGVELRDELGAAGFASAVREGVALRDAEIVAFVLDEIHRATA